MGISAFPIETLTSLYSSEKEFDNKISITARECSCSLSYLGEEDSVLYFQISKWDDHNITVSDEEEKKDYKSFLKRTQKVKHISYFAILPKHHLILALFNHRAFHYSIPALIDYIELRHHATLTINPITRTPTDADMKKYLEKVRHITFKSATTEKKDFRAFEKENENLSAKDKLKKYTEKEEHLFTLQRLQHFNPKQLWDLITQYREKKQHNQIIISGANFGEIDILDELAVKWNCFVDKDSDSNPLLADFKKEVKRLVSERSDFLDQYI